MKGSERAARLRPKVIQDSQPKEKKIAQIVKTAGAAVSSFREISKMRDNKMYEGEEFENLVDKVLTTGQGPGLPEDAPKKEQYCYQLFTAVVKSFK